MLQQPQHELSHLINPLRRHLRQYPFDELTNTVVAQNLHRLFERQTTGAATERESQRTQSVRTAVPMRRRLAGAPTAKKNGQVKRADFAVAVQILLTAATAQG